MLRAESAVHAGECFLSAVIARTLRETGEEKQQVCFMSGGKLCVCVSVCARTKQGKELGKSGMDG